MKIPYILCGLIITLFLAYSPVAGASPASSASFYTKQELVSKENQAIELIKGEKFAEAYSLLQPLSLQFSDSDTLNFLLGQCAANLQNFEEAIGYYKKISPKNPAYARIRLELGRAYAMIGENDAARAEFNAVLATTPPPVVAENIQKFLTLLDTQKRVNLRTTFGYVHDSNANAGPNDIITHGNWTVDAHKQSDSGTYLELNLDLTNPYRDGKSWQNDFSYSNTSYFRLHNLSWQELTFSSGPILRNKVGALSLPLTAQTTYIGGVEYNRSYGLAPQWQIKLKQNQQLLLSASILKQDYPTNLDRSGSSWSLGIADRIFLRPEKAADYIEAGADYTKNITGAAVYNNEIWSEHLTYYHQFTPSLWGLLETSHAQTYYQGIDTYSLWILQSTASRQNTLNGWRAVLGLTAGPWNYSLSYTKNQVGSNIDIYSYNRTLIQLQASRNF